MNAVSLTLPYPPATNNLFFNRKGGGRAKSARYTSWRTEALWEAKRQHAGRVDGPYALTIIACRPDNRRRDLDGIAKPISDALTAAGIIEDDHLCQKLTMAWGTAGKTVFVQVISTREAA